MSGLRRLLSFLAPIASRSRVDRIGALRSVRPRTSRRTAFEPLEARRVLAAQLSTAWPEALPRFESIDDVKSFLVEKAMTQYGGQFGQPALPYYYLYAKDLAGPGPVLATDASVSTNLVSAGYTQTNVQVEGVDEADLVETDGEYLFVVRNGELTITAVHSADGMSVASRYELPGMPAGEFLAGDRLTIITTEWHGWGIDPLFGRVAIDALPFSPSMSVQRSVTVTVLDVADRASPQLVEQTKLDGSYLDARAIGDKVFVIVSNSDLELPPPIPVCATPESPVESGLGSGDSRIANAVMPRYFEGWKPEPFPDCRYEEREAYLTRIDAKLDSIVDGLLPHYTAWDGEQEFVRGGILHEPGDIVRPVNEFTSQLLSVVAFDIFDDQSGPVAAEAIPTAWNSTIYASRDHLYVFQSTQGNWWDGMTTDVLAFTWDVASGEIHATATGSVPGQPLDQFSADEHEGRLRVATTQRRFVEGVATTDNGVYVLEKVGSTLKIAGAVTGIAPRESLRSVRFAGDKGYVVTFEQIDPFFTLDLSEPSAPRVAGELKIPGYSGYLQVLDDTHVLGIGRVPGEGGTWNVQVSLFDVSDVKNPTRTGSYSFDGSIWSSNAEWEHHAVTWMPELGLVAMPINGARYAEPSPVSGEASGLVENRSGLALLHVETHPVANALPTVRLETVVPQDAPLRSLRIGDWIYAISATEILVVSGAFPHAVVEILDLGPPPGDSQDAGMVYPAEYWFGDSLLVDPVESPSPKSPVDPRTSPSPWDDDQLTGPLHAAADRLAEKLGLSVDDIRLVTAEAASGPDGDGTQRVLNLVFGAGDRRYYFRATVGEGAPGQVELIAEDFVFPSESLQREWHNAEEPCDIDGDGIIAPLDGLLVINQLNSKGSMPLRSERPLRSIDVESRAAFVSSGPRKYLFDSSGDDLLSPLDALMIVNRLNEDAEPSGGAEGEFRVVESVESVASAWTVGADLGVSGDRPIAEATVSTVPSASLNVRRDFRDAAIRLVVEDDVVDLTWNRLAGRADAGLNAEIDDLFAGDSR